MGGGGGGGGGGAGRRVEGGEGLEGVGVLAVLYTIVRGDFPCVIFIVYMAALYTVSRPTSLSAAAARLEL